MVSEVRVDLGERSYPVVFEALDRLGERMAKEMTPGRCVVVSNDVVGPLYAAKCLSSLKQAGWDASYVEIPDGEQHKDGATYLGLVNKLLDLQVDRKTPIVALGGGVTTDIVGFAAATALRGLPFANVPTTLLAQVDASVGGKTGVNTPQGKNLLGSFWQPFLVHMAVETISTLSDPEFRCGLGEVIKHAVLEETPEGKPSTAFMEWLEGNAASVLAREDEALEYIIKRCVEIKAAVVVADERESGKRALLNLGHTVGHAIEAVVGYGGLRHGEAVAMGTIAEAHLAQLRGFCDAALPKRISALTQALGLPVGLPSVDVPALVQATLADKKREATHISVTMPYAIGDVRLVKFRPEELTPAFESLLIKAASDAPAAAASSVTPSKAYVKTSLSGPEGAAGARPKGSNAFASGANQNAGNFLVDDRPTSRVLRPPGGGVSTSLFGPEPTTKQPQPAAAAPSAPAAAPVAPAATAPPAARVSSNAFASGSNPNAGNVLVDGRPSSRVREPPGGKSSVFFG